MKKIIIIALLMTACSHEKNNSAKILDEDIQVAPTIVEKPTLEEAPIIDDEEDELVKDSISFDYSAIVFDDLKLPVVSPASSIKMLTTGQFHHEEVWPEADQQQWTGLFVSENGYYLKNTDIKLEIVKDELNDEEGEKSGWEVSIDNQYQCIMLISGIGLKEGIVPAIEINNKEPIPGDTMTIDTLTFQASLYITGIKNKVSEEQYEVFNYKMNISADVDGKKQNQTIVAQPDFDDAMISILWAGDLDGDRKIDLIVDTARHYNVKSPTLFLSSMAKHGSILACVAIHRTVGC